MHRIAFIAAACLGCAIAFQPPASMAQSTFDGRVSDSPIPAPKEDDDGTLPQVVRDDGTVPQGSAGNADGGTFESSPLPSVLRPGEDDDAPLTPAEGTASEGNEDTDGGGRFVRAPEGSGDQADPEVKQTSGSPIPPPQTALQNGARLRQLDKMTGSIVTFDIGVGQTMKVERMRIHLDACRSPSDNDTHGTMAFLHIWDTKNPEEEAMFHGWMFAESPALSALDHPRYDLWVISCTIISGATSAANE